MRTLEPETLLTIVQATQRTLRHACVASLDMELEGAEHARLVDMLVDIRDGVAMTAEALVQGIDPDRLLGEPT